MTRIRNQATLERVARMAVGLAALSLTVVGPRSAWGLLGLLPLVTGLAGCCPIYRLLGVGTCPLPRGGR